MNDKDALIKRFMKKVHQEPNSGCWLWTGSCCPKGYGMICIDGMNKKAHRVSWTLFRHEPLDGFFVCHKCDVRGCVNPDHLFLGTAKDNTADQKSKGRLSRRRGAKCNFSKLTEEQAIEILELSNSGMSQIQLGKLFSVSPACIANIWRGASWAHIRASTVLEKGQ